MANYILIPGYGLGAWALSDVTNDLRKKEKDVYPLTINGSGDNSYLANKIITPDRHTSFNGNLIRGFLYKALFLLLLLSLKTSFSFAQSEWTLKTDKEGIKIYTSLVPDSKIKAIKVEAEFNATPAQMVSLLMDVKTSTEWVYHLKSVALVKQVSPSELYYYSEVSLAWPAANRDFVAHLTVTQNPDTKVVTVDGPAVTGMVPIKQGIVRISDSNGKWIITPLGNDRIKVEYTIHVDPAGSLPSWMVNMFATDGPQMIFKNIRLQLQKAVCKNNILASTGN